MAQSFLFTTLFLCFLYLGSSKKLSKVKCQDGWKPFNNRCYYFSGDKKTNSWTTAEKECKKLNSRAYLVSISSKEEEEFISSNIGNAQCFIGANDIDTEGNWVWSDGRPWGFTNWKTGEPNNHHNIEDCAIRGYPENTNYWNDVP